MNKLGKSAEKSNKNDLGLGKKKSPSNETLN